MKREGVTLISLMRGAVKVRRKGLTLMELLVVIGIILSLAGLIFGVVRLGIDAARKTQCINNLRQIYLATKLYEEYHGAPPKIPFHFVCWKLDLKSVLVCPADPYQGRSCERAIIPNVFVPYSYRFIYWDAYWFPKGKFVIPDWGKELIEKMIETYRKEMDKSDAHFYVCPFHKLAALRDGNVRRATRYTWPPPRL